MFFAGDPNLGAYENTFLGGFPRVLFAFSAGMLIYKIRPAQNQSIFAPALSALVLITLLFTPLRLSKLEQTFIIIGLLPTILYASASVKLENQNVRQVCLQLGRLSYPLYILHMPILRLTNAAIAKLPFAISPVVATMTNLLSCVVFSAFALKLFDEVIRHKLVEKFLSKQTRREAP